MSADRSLLGPVFWMEMRLRTRDWRYYLVRAMFVLGVFAAISFSYAVTVQQLEGAQTTIRDYADLGATLFATFSVVQFLGLLFFVPLYFGGAIAGDRERDVLELLFTTQLSNHEIVAGKVFARLVDMLTLLALGFTVVSLTSVLGGVPWLRGLYVVSSTLSSLLFAVALATLVSIVAQRVVAAIAITYFLMLFVWCVGPLMGIVHMEVTGGNFTSAIAVAFAANPLFNMLPRVLSEATLPPWGDTYWPCVVGHTLAGATLLLFDIAMLRRLDTWGKAAKGRILSLPKGRSAAKRVWHNPVTWREVNTIAAHHRLRWARLLGLLSLSLVSVPFWSSWIADAWRGYAPLADDLDPLWVVVTATAIVAWLLATLQGSVSLAYECEHKTWDVLLGTPLRGADIVLGKFLGVLRSSSFAIAFPLISVLVGWLHGVCSGRAAVLAAVVAVVYFAFFAVLGIFVSLLAKSSIKAVAWGGGILICLCIVLPVVVETQLGYSAKGDVLPVAFVSPSLSLSYAIHEPAIPVASSVPAFPLLAAFSPAAIWSFLRIFMLAHAGLALVVAAAGILAMIVIIERRERAGKRNLPARPERAE